MVEILGLVYVSSFILSISVLSWHYYSTQKNFSSTKLTILNENLARVGLFWSNATADFADLKENCYAQDRQKVNQSILLIGILALGSLPGFLLLTTVVFSLHFFARSRKEKSVFASPLSTEKDLPFVEIEKWLQTLGRN